MLEYEGQNTAQAARLEHGRGLAGADELERLDALLGQVLARLVLHVDDEQTVADGAQRALDLCVVEFTKKMI